MMVAGAFKQNSKKLLSSCELQNSYLPEYSQPTQLLQLLQGDYKGGGHDAMDVCTMDASLLTYFLLLGLQLNLK